MDNGNLTETDHDYAVTGKIMLIAIVVLFIVIIFMLCLHVQIRCYLRRQEHLRRTRNRNVRPPPHFVFYMDSSAPPELTLPISRGLNASVISSLPVFNFSKTHTQVVECAVCLSEFEDGETGRVLPKCNHSFHIDCIDMWFHSHSTCPLCRAPVEPLIVQQTRPEVTVSVCQTELIVSDGKQTQLGVTGRSESFGGGVSGCESPSSFRSQMSRVLSFTRILSRDRERKGSFSPSSSSSGCIVGSDSGRVGV